MSNNARDTQFQGFAKALFEELHNSEAVEWFEPRDDHWREEWQEIIARRAYDLAFHAIDNSRSNDMEDWQTSQIIPYVPDMQYFPDVEMPEVVE